MVVAKYANKNKEVFEVTELCHMNLTCTLNNYKK